MTRQNPGKLEDFELEIEARARRIHGHTLRDKRKKRQKQTSPEETTSATHEESTESLQNPTVSESASINPVDANNTPIGDPTCNTTTMGDQTIRELAAAPAVQQLLYTTFPQGETSFQLKTDLIHLLPNFHGLPSESQHKHLAKFHFVCSTMKPQRISEDQIKLRAFLFSLSGIANE
ncbi:hypothetical protein GQ457_14G021910 [Hibiscus cannabinus]